MYPYITDNEQLNFVIHVKSILVFKTPLNTMFNILEFE